MNDEIFKPAFLSGKLQILKKSVSPNQMYEHLFCFCLLLLLFN